MEKIREYELLAPLIAQSIENLKFLETNMKIVIVQVTDAPHSPILLTPSDLSDPNLTEKINLKQTIIVEKFISLAINRALQEAADNLSENSLQSKTKKTFQEFSDSINKFLNQMLTNVLKQCDMLDDQIASNFFKEYSNGIFDGLPVSDQIAAVEKLSRYLARPLQNPEFYIEALERNLKNDSKEIKKLMKNAEFNLSKILTMPFSNESNEFENFILPYQFSYQKIAQLSNNTPWASKGIACNPQNNQQYMFINQSGLMKSFEIKDNKIKTLYKKQYFNEVGNYEDSICVSPNGTKFLITFYNRKCILICGSKEGDILKEIKLTSNITHGVWVSNQDVAASLKNGEIHIINIEDEKDVKAKKISPCYINCILADTQTKSFYIGSDDGSLAKISATMLEVEWKYDKLHKFDILVLAKKDNYIASGSGYWFGAGDEKVLIVLKESTKEIIYKSDNQINSFMHLSFSPSTDLIIAATRGEIFTVNLKNKRTEKKMAVPEDNSFFFSGVFDWSGLFLLAVLENGNLYKIKMLSAQIHYFFFFILTMIINGIIAKF